MADATDAKPRTKHRKSTCAGCRRRKSKCDGKTPRCTTCIACKDDCVYDKPPSLAYVRSLEDEVHDLRNQLKAVKTQAWLNKSPTHAASRSSLSQAVESVPVEEKKTVPVSSPDSDSTSTSQFSDPSRAAALALRGLRPLNWETDISVDDHGSVSFHNSTSAVHEPPTPQQIAHLSPTSFSSPPSVQEERRTKRDLVTNANQQKQLEHFAIANTAAKVNIPKDISEELLKYHWCWIHPLFVFVYRPAFTRGMTLVDASQPGAPDPPYFSETLLRVMHAHCARFLNHDVVNFNMHMTATEFMQRMTHDARVGLGMETLKTSSIPTIQALLQQSAREVVFGRSSQGWLYGGMAFRMAFDMGIHLPSDKLQTFVKSLSAEDIEIRKRLFWSCYTWDKVLSLYLGRMPAFDPVTDEVPLNFLDLYSDTDLWAPYYGETPGPEANHNPPYPPCPGNVVSCFQQLCRLCVVVNDLLQHVYSSESGIKRSDEAHSAEAKAAHEEPFMRITHHLAEWRTTLPPHLAIRVDRMPALAPPVHIMSLNLLYHAVLILLHRPVIENPNTNPTAVSRSYQTALSATAAIHDLLILQANTFGLGQLSYLNAYCAYMAATIAVVRFEREHRPGEDETVVLRTIGLEFLLEVLGRTATAMPALEKSNAIIRRRLQAVKDRHALRLRQTSFATVMPTTNAVNPSPSPAALATAPFPSVALSSPEYPTPLAAQQIGDPSASLLSNQDGPTQYQSGTRSGLSFEPPVTTFAEEFLPAFPGQQFPIGSEHSFGSNEVDTQARMALLGYNLDPHPRLNPGDIDWSLMDSVDVPVGTQTM